MKLLPGKWLCLMVCIGAGLSLAHAGKPQPGKPVIQDRIPGPGEARALMADRKAAKRLQASEAQQREAERKAAQERKKAQARKLAWEKQLRAEREAEKARRLAAQQAQQLALVQQNPKPPRIAALAETSAPDTIETRLTQLQQRRSRGEISGDVYLAERQRIIYGDQFPSPRRAIRSEPSVEQRLAALTQKRRRGEINGDAYLAARQHIIHGN